MGDYKFYRCVIITRGRLEMECSVCEKEIDNADRFCPYCGINTGEELDDEVIFCRSCGKPSKRSLQFCSRCGNSLDDSAIDRIATTNRQSYLTRSTIYMILSPIFSVVCIALMFMHWMSKPQVTAFGLIGWAQGIFDTAHSWNTGNFNYQSSAGMLVMSFIVSPCVVSMITHAVNMYAVMTYKRYTAACSYASFVSLTVAVIGLVILVAVTNEQFSQSYGQGRTPFSLSIVPFLALLLSGLTNFVLIRRSFPGNNIYTQQR